MRGILVLGLAAASLVIASASMVDAQCAFVHPAKAKMIRAPLVQAYVSCSLVYGERVANTETENGVASCYPAETFAHSSGSGTPVSGSWMFGPQGEGTLTLAVHGDDLAITVALKDVRDEEGARVTATGSLYLEMRATLVDPVGGLMTTVDLPFFFAVPVEKGAAKVKTTLFSAGPFSPLVAASCKSLELSYRPLIRDSNGAWFASIGLFLP